MNICTHAKEHALITGASRGIGLELAREFARHNFDLVLVARDGKRLDEAAEGLKRDFGVDVHTIVADLSSADAPQAIFDRIGDQRISVDVLVNNAGVGSYGNFADTDMDQELQMMQINMLSLTHLTKLFLRQMLTRKRGRIVNVSSLGGYQPGGPKFAVYFATKSFVLSFSKALCVELRGTGVSVTAICPGPVDTNFKDANNLGDTKVYRFAMTPESVAKSAYRGIMRRRSVVVPGLISKILAIAGELPPRRIALEVNGWLMK